MPNTTNGQISFSRVWAMPSPDTFDIPPIMGFVQKYLLDSQVSIDPFARNKRLATYTNDLNPDTAAQDHMDATDWVKQLRHTFDLAIFDPPYSLEQCARSYRSIGIPVTMRDTQIFGRWTECKDRIAKLCIINGVVLSFGWNTQGMGIKRGFEIVEILLVCHGAAHNDTICMAERKIVPEPTLFDASHLNTVDLDTVTRETQ